MTLANWVRWAFRPCKYWNHYPSAVFVRQASRDLGRAVTHEEFVAVMKDTGFEVSHQHGDSIHFYVQDSNSKRVFYRQRYVAADETMQHPLTIHSQHDHA
jgi:hypothetical protein